MDGQQQPVNSAPVQNIVPPQLQSNFYKKFSFVLIAIVLVAGVAGGAYMFGKAGVKTEEKSGEKVISPTQALGATPSLTPTSEAVIPAAWKLYEAVDYVVSFRYPGTWETPKVEINKKGEGMIDLDYKSLIFEDKPDGSWKSVELSNFSTYQDNAILKAKVEKLKTIYQTKTVDPKEWFWLPPSNAAVVATSKVKYLENSDSSMRGVYYYAYIGQGEIEPVSTTRKLFNLVIVLTDGKAKIVQIQIRTPYTNFAGRTYAELNDCNLDTGRTKCMVDKELVDNLSIYKNISSSIVSK